MLTTECCWCKSFSVPFVYGQIVRCVLCDREIVPTPEATLLSYDHYLVDRDDMAKFRHDLDGIPLEPTSGEESATQPEVAE